MCNSMRDDYLFVNGDMHAVLENQKGQVRTKIQGLKPDYLLNVNEQQLVTAIVSEMTLDVPVIRDDEIHIASHGEAQVDVSGDHMRAIYGRGPLYITGNQTIIAVPFDGDAEFFKIKPSTYNYNPPMGRIVGQEIHLTYVKADQDAAALKRDYEHDVAQIKQYLQWQRESVTQHNAQLPELVQSEITKRKTALIGNSQMVAALGLPIKKRADAPSTYSVPVERQRPRIERPKAVPAAKPEPTLSVQDYDSILSIATNMVLVMERSPKAFETMGEEDIRSHFLVQLNGQYEGLATGETFNFEGKTDILIRVDGRNVFIAECKFWKGEKEFLKAIDQLLSYLSWRDTKAAVFLFNRNTNFSEVLATVKAAIPRHACFARDLGHHDESIFKSVFHQQHDKGRELFLTVMVFDVPKRKSK
jgi:hypothetical protein